MSDLCWLMQAQIERLGPFFAKSHGKVLSGIIFINRNGLRWRDAPAEYGPAKTLYTRWNRWREKGVFTRMLAELSAQSDVADTLMIDATHLKARRTASSLRAKKGGRARLIGQTRGGLNSRLHALTDAIGRPIRMMLTGGNRRDYVGARALLGNLPRAKTMLAHRGSDADGFPEALQDKGIGACIPGRKHRKAPIPHDQELYKKRHRIENSFGRLKDWRRIATRYDRCPDIFLCACACARAAVVTFWLES